MIRSRRSWIRRKQETNDELVAKDREDERKGKMKKRRVDDKE